MNLTDTMENDLLDALVGVTTVLSSTMSLAIFSGNPTDTGSVATELSGGGYARKLLSGLFTTATGTDGTTSNTSAITFDTATGDWTEATHVGIMKSDVETTDDMVAWIELVSPITITSGQPFEYAIGKLTVNAA